eukprot:CAMPEP_0174300760 /NCGR_PEP_ID=MMETSP0809-20121228/58652_1 /TAXON_ID=73025 ORGANISM="Eutreptiella gymnastica-like, Strain CCMP1594" /NCGR_SAMPLE_ID=MMETSP0809 /ASSEMBLY_ACC=CAM_ASM_000658 /LENGTH=223 /DNA_ID=CAMNT_0015406393 /DNA_START=29 /DNA_END=700 /DNA_ORIENTATION=+
MSTENATLLSGGQNELPNMDDLERDKGEKKSRIFLSVMMIAQLLIGFGVAVAVYKLGSTEKYDRKIAAVKGEDMQWAYLAAVVFTRLVAWVNLYPMVYKARLMQFDSGNLRANMYIYKTPAGQPVLLDEGPEVGKYNRANRSLTHFTEWAAAMCVAFLMVAYCFPVPAFVLTIVYALGRVLHQIGYAAKGYGGHAKGFMLNSIANSTMEGFLLLVALKGFDIM